MVFLHVCRDLRQKVVRRMKHEQRDLESPPF